MNFQGSLSPFWSSPLKAHRFVDAIPTQLVISLHLPSHHATKKAQLNGPKKKKKITDKSMQHSEKELNCFLLSEKVNGTL